MQNPITQPIMVKKMPRYVSYPLAVLALIGALGAIQIIQNTPGKAPSDAPTKPPTMALGPEGVVGIGETLSLDGVSVTLHSIVADYRCPSDVQCIQAGAIVANVTLDNGVLRETFNMPSDEVPRPFGTHRIAIVDIAPPLLSTEPADPNAYRITFRSEPMTKAEQAEQYFRANISALSPEPPVLGGTFYVTEVAFPEAGRAVVSYEDGHIALVADVTYGVSAGGVVQIDSFTMRADEPVSGRPTLPPLPSENDEVGICNNLCGNGTCEEMVCMGSGCPCAETPDSCPQDCAL